MNHIMAPGWVQMLKLSQDSHSTEAAGLAAVEGPRFWKQLVRELALAVDDLPVLHLQGKLSKFGNPSGQEWCRIMVARRAVVPINTLTDVYYRYGDRAIWWRPAGKEAFALPFVIADGGAIGVAATNGFPPMDPARTAQAIMQGIFKWIAPEMLHS
jgi:hypothetical protein